MSSFTIRTYKEEDKKNLIKIFRLNTPQFFAPEEEEDFKNYLEDEIEHYFVLESKNQLVGSGGVNFIHNGKIAKISWDILHPEFQGEGMGTELLKFRLNFIVSNFSITKIRVRTSQFAFTFYDKNGFELQEIIKDYWAKGYDLYVMELNKIQ